MKVDFSKFSYDNLDGYKKIKAILEKNTYITEPSFKGEHWYSLVSKQQNLGKKQACKNKYDITIDSINVVGTNCVQNKDNKRQVKDYIRDFMKNDRKFTVLYDKYNDEDEIKDLTVILIPASKNNWDFLTVTLDAIVAKDECRALVNQLVNKKITNVSCSCFKNEIVSFLTTLS